MPSALQKRMAFWSIELNGTDLTREMGHAVGGIDIDYELNSPTPVQATVQVASIGYLEDFFAKPNRLTIKMGWSPVQLVTMIKDAEIVVNPEGSAHDYLDYTVTAIWPAKPLKVEKSRVFPLTKSSVIARIASDNGLVPFVQIADLSVIPAKEQPVQNMQNDMQFLLQCAQKWNCLTWVDQDTKTLYFVDAKKAHDLGGTLRKLNFEDLEPEYQLGYRTDSARNNVAAIKWSHGAGKGGSPGQPAVVGGSEASVSHKPQNYHLEIDGVKYQIKPAVMAQIVADPSIGLKIAGLISSSGLAAIDADLRQYFDPLNASTTNSPDSPTVGVQGVTMTVDLNVGDPYLRPPRKCRIFAGGNSPKAKNSDLPGFLLNSADKPKSQAFNIQKVKTSLQSGMIRTSLTVIR